VGILSRPVVHSEALVLRVWSCGESSAVVSLLTGQEGFVKVLAKGVRKPGSRLRPLIEPGRLVEVEFSLDPGRDLQFLRSGSVVLDPMTGVPTLEKTAYLLGALELVDRCRPLGHAAGHRGTVGLFEVCGDYVRMLFSPSCRAPANLFFAFEWELLERHGMAPEIDSCISCGGSLAGTAGSPLWFSPGDGGAVCGSCAIAGLAGLRPLGREALRFLGNLSTDGLDCPPEGPMPRSLRREVGTVLHFFMGYHLPGYRLPAALELLRGERPGSPATAEPEDLAEENGSQGDEEA